MTIYHLPHTIFKKYSLNFNAKAEMKMKLILFVLFLVLCNFSAGQVPDSLKYISLGPGEFQKALQNDENALLIDVREFFEYKKSRIDNAHNIPSSDNLEVSADTLNKDYPLFLYCTSGFRSKRVAKQFYDKGFLKLYSLDGGITAWKKAGLPVNRKKIRK
jgi:rhodanese-related sulfurtransferase